MKKVLVYCLLLTFIISIPACSKQKEQRKSPPVPVTAAPAVKKTMPVFIEAIGTVEAFKTISVKSRVTGSIKKIHFTEGRAVKKGDLLIELDSREYEAELNKALADLAKDKAQAGYAEDQVKRYADLVKKDYVAREQYDQLKANHASLEAAVKADEAIVENNRIQVRYCSIHSPIDGRIGAIKVDEGNVVNADSTEIAVINQLQPVSVSFVLPEKDLPMVKRYSAQGTLGIKALVPGDPNSETGELAFIDNAIDKTTGTIALKGTFENRNNRLWPGQYVDVVLDLAREPDAVLVPSRSIEQGPQGRYVYVVKSDSTVEMRPVVPGRSYLDDTVIRKGIREGEQVVTDGQLRLSPGDRVAVRKTK